MPVNTEHEKYTRRKKQWEIIRDCIEGEDVIKAKGGKYLPIALCRTRAETEARYNNYRQRARWVNYTDKTRKILVGLITRRNPVINVPDEMLGILRNIDRKGTSFSEFVSNVLNDLIVTNFGGVLVDFPTVNGSITKGLAEKEGIRAYANYYPAESIINWWYDTVHGTKQLVKVVLKEEKEVLIDEFTVEYKTQYRVLELVDGIYQQRVFSPLDNGDYEVETYPFEINGQKLDYIPFTMLADDEPSKPLLLDLAFLNIGHYQKLADYENGVHNTAYSTGWVTGHSRVVDEETGEEEAITLGGDTFLVFEEADAKVGNLCFAGDGLVHLEKAIAMAEQNIRTEGRRMLIPDATKSVDAMKADQEGENAILANFAIKVGYRLGRVLQIIAMLEGYDESNIYVELCTDYDSKAFDPNALNSIANLAEANKFPLPYIFECLKSGEYAPKDSTFQEYVTLLDLEQSGASPMEVFSAYKEMRQKWTSK